MSVTGDGSGAMFDRIASRYDLLNRVLSLGMDRSWRTRLVSAVVSEHTRNVLDVATGTADVAIKIAKRRSELSVVGLDPSVAMLEVGRQKCAHEGLESRIELVVGDGMELPFDDDHFDSTCIAFGIRNVPDRARCLAEMRRVTRVGGIVAVLELAEPEDGPFSFFARAHVRHIVPRVGAFISGAAEYRYLQSSIAVFPGPVAFAKLMQDAGLGDVRTQRMSFGAAHLYLGVVTQSS